MKFFGRCQDKQIDEVKSLIKAIEHEVFCKYRYEAIEMLELACDAQESYGGRIENRDRDLHQVQHTIQKFLSKIDEEIKREILKASYPELKKKESK